MSKLVSKHQPFASAQVNISRIMLKGGIIISMLCFLAPLQAQNQQLQQRLEQLKAQKIAYITQMLQLTPTEAQQFWPVYNEFATKKEKLNEQQKIITANLSKGWADLTDKQKEDISDKFINNRLEQAQLESEYHLKFKQVLPVSKVLKLYEAENQFKSQLIRQLREQEAIRQQPAKSGRK
jgi:hypothetical protein